MNDGWTEFGRLDQSGNSGSHLPLDKPSVLSHCTVGSSSDLLRGSSVVPSRSNRLPRGLCRSIDVWSYPGERGAGTPKNIGVGLGADRFDCVDQQHDGGGLQPVCVMTTDLIGFEGEAR